MRRRRRPLTPEEKIRNVVLRRRRQADRNARRRAEKWGVRALHIELEVIAEHDGWVCYLCGKEVSMHEASFEHVIPLCDGGTHTPDNVRLAHRLCNSRKGSKSLSEINRPRREGEVF